MSGKMRANFKTRVFEKGGDFSTDQFSRSYIPFKSFAGVSIPKDRWGNHSLSIEKENTFGLVNLDQMGKVLPGKEISVGIYHAEWRWWWHNETGELARFNSDQHIGAFISDTLRTGANGRALFDFRPDNHGMYLIRVCDVESGHCSGGFFYSGYYYGEEDERSAAAKIYLSSDKNTYKAGEEVTLNIPSASQSTILVSLESNKGIIASHRIAATGNLTKFTFKATTEMLPNIYAHVSLIQPHNHGENDLPLRMYGVLPVLVEDPESRLYPVLSMNDELEPESQFTVQVSEKNKREMAYTVAVVDEGLLDLTRFKTPDPWAAFYAKEALTINTWDLYDQVLGAYGGPIDRIMTIGGDGTIVEIQSVSEVNRFKPVVMHKGPFYLEAGEKANHTFNMPNYVGSVRAMVVAASEKSYGKIEQTVPVKNPLMVLATLPRVLSPGEKINVPVNVFAMDEDVKDVTISIRTNQNLLISGKSSRMITFLEVGDEIISFSLEATDSIGKGEIWIEATSGNEKASQYIEIPISNPNPFITEGSERVLEKNNSWEGRIETIGMPGTNETVLEFSSFFPVNLDKRLKYLIRYPYGCIEQTTSAAFPQLYVDQLIELPPTEKSRTQFNIRSAIEKMDRFIRPEGGMAYWPGGGTASDWGTSYAGHFLLEAREGGYFVESGLLEDWKSYQKSAAQAYDSRWIGTNRSGYKHSGLTQAYRLFTLALAGDPAWGAMNRLRNNEKLSNTARFMLAAAYAHSGQKEVSKELITNLGTTVKSYRETGHSYGSDTRDRAMMVESLLILGEKSQALTLVKRIADDLGSSRWYSTQTTAFGLIALSKFAGGSAGKPPHASYSIPGVDTVTIIKASKPMYRVQIDADRENSKIFNITNLGETPLYARVVHRGQPLEPTKVLSQSNLIMQVSYSDTQGKAIDPGSIPLGEDFLVNVKVRNPGTLVYNLDEMALQMILPSGWEIINQRLDILNRAKSDAFEYQDIRDDRIYTFFDLHGTKSKNFQFALNASYEGWYLLPEIYCEAMYDHAIHANVPGQWVEVVKNNDNILRASARNE
jgi:uncharacterized protein YfaS (alpha-2-macroglobulin family)